MDAASESQPVAPCITGKGGPTPPLEDFVSEANPQTASSGFYRGECRQSGRFGRRGLHCIPRPQNQEGQPVHG